MRIRTTERVHNFTKKLFERLQVFGIQGLTLTKNLEFSGGIEAIDYEPNEIIDLEKVFPRKEVYAKFFLTQVLGIPLYFITQQNELFKIYGVLKIKDEIEYKLKYSCDGNGFVEWWKKLKGTSQTKGFYEASTRVKKSSFDKILTANGLAWGGNVDGFMIKDKKIIAIIENIYTQKNPLNSEGANPAVYFLKRGPNYNTWLSTVLLAKKLNVPLFLFTFEGNNDKERLGFAVIDKLDPTGIYYRNNLSPNNNIIGGIDKITETIFQNLNQPTPTRL